MIKISHPKLTTKPPINSKMCIGKRKTVRRDKILENERKQKMHCNSDKGQSEYIECIDCSEHEDRSDMMINKKFVNSTSDCNQNIIESDSSIELQYCNILHDLEETLTNHEPEVVSIGTLCFPVENSSADIHIATDEKEETALIPRGATTYDDIISFLSTLEQHLQASDITHKDSESVGSEFVEGITDDLKSSLINNAGLCNQNLINQSDKIQDELDTALLQLEDRDATIIMLKNELITERKAACEKLEIQKKNHSTELQVQKTKYQNIIKRHQKFIKQLIDEKKALTDKCNTLTQTIKDIEVKQQRELKVAVEKQLIEIQRTKEFCMASERIRRERWLEAKTSKIKEMTVKGLEPELRNMIDQHQQEILDIRSAHMKELQEVELRAIRRSNHQLEQLRIELTESHNKVLISEKEAIRLRFQEKFDQQEELLQSHQRKYFEQLRIQKEKYSNEQARKDAEKEDFFKQIISENREKIDALTKQYQEEKKLLRENLEAERNAWMENYKSNQNAKFEMAETRIRDECTKERDRQIEIAIERLEKETRLMKDNLQAGFDKKLQYLQDKYETELQVSRDSEKLLKERLRVAQEKIDDLEIYMQRIECKLGQSSADLNEANRMVEKITRERDHAKILARQEIEYEKKELEDKIILLQKDINHINANRDLHITQLYSRIKLIITQKDVTINNVKREANDVKNKCEHLEKLLNQQRKEYILKTL